MKINVTALVIAGIALVALLLAGPLSWFLEKDSPAAGPAAGPAASLARPQAAAREPAGRPATADR